jgi:hypothetical protein
MRRFLLLGVLAAAAGCGGPAPGLEAAVSDLGDGPVRVLDLGPYRTIRACSGLCVSTYSFWVDLAVRNDGYHKGVGVKYSGDGWRTEQVAWARYEGDLGGGYERWGVDVDLGTGVQQPYPEVVVAAFAELSGATQWDPKNDYSVYDSVLPQRPVRLLSSAASYDGAAGVVTGRVRVFDLAYEKQVTLLYTADDWQSAAEASARYAGGDDWTFELPGLVGPGGRLPDVVRFAVRYDVAGRTFWDNNGGRDYERRLHPRFEETPDGPTDAPRSGIFWPGASARSDLPVVASELRVDGGPWLTGERMQLSSQALGDGVHQLDVRATLAGGYQAVHRLTFETRDRLVPRAGWAPVPDLVDPRRTATAWDVRQDSQGRLLVLWDSGRVGRYAGFGDVNAPFLFEAPPAPYQLFYLAVDAQDRAYAVAGDRQLLRWREDGALDPTFGPVDLTGVVGQRSLCAVGQPVAGPDALYIPDTCNHRVLRFDLDGRFTGEVQVGHPGGVGVPVHAVHDGQALWVAAQGDLVRVVDTAGGGLAEERRLSFSEPLSVSGLALWPGGGFYVTTQENALAVVAPDGAVLTRWSGGPRGAPYLGAFNLGRAPLVLGDGAVTVLGVEGATLARFEGALLP